MKKLALALVGIGAIAMAADASAITVLTTTNTSGHFSNVTVNGYTVPEQYGTPGDGVPKATSLETYGAILKAADPKTYCLKGCPVVVYMYGDKTTQTGGQTEITTGTAYPRTYEVNAVTNSHGYSLQKDGSKMIIGTAQ